MKRLLIVLCLAAVTPLATGCAMCCNTHDYDYPSYGGKWERGDRQWGRVGSNLSGAGAPMIGETGGYSSDQIIEQPAGSVIQGDVIQGGVVGESTDYPIYPLAPPLQ